VRTNVVLDDELVAEAQALSQIKTKRELIDTALREFVEHRKRLDIRELKGALLLHDDYDYKEMRRTRSKN
jgi:Arc/MetJ family transcription regulator